jgi:hypothetical protein
MVDMDTKGEDAHGKCEFHEFHDNVWRWSNLPGVYFLKEQIGNCVLQK